jgi:hypothetical protein
MSCVRFSGNIGRDHRLPQPEENARGGIQCTYSGTTSSLKMERYPNCHITDIAGRAEELSNEHCGCQGQEK